MVVNQRVGWCRDNNTLRIDTGIFCVCFRRGSAPTGRGEMQTSSRASSFEEISVSLEFKASRQNLELSNEL